MRVPEGYRIDPVVVGLTYPNSIAIGEGGTVYVCEGGSAWPPWPFLGARVLALEPSGRLSVVVEEAEAPLMGIAYRAGAIYATLHSDPNRVVRYDLRSGSRETVVDALPPSFHPPNGPLFSEDGTLWYGVGAATLNGIAGPEGYLMGYLGKWPHMTEVPGQDVKLTGHNVRSPDPGAPVPMMADTAGFKPFGVSARKGEVVRGQKLCTSSVLRANPDGSDVELVAWGIREGYGMSFDEQGELYVASFCMEDNGIRPVGEDPGAIFHVKGARSPRGISTPEWYGYPDFCQDGLPVTHETHRPLRGPPPQPIIDEPPRVAGRASALITPHAGVGRMDFSRSSGFGHRGELFMAQVGTFFPLNSPFTDDAANGFAILRVDVKSGKVAPFVQNTHPGPASARPPGGSGGLERPIDCKFSADGSDLWILDIGRIDVKSSHLVTWGRTGVLWRLRREEAA